MHQTTAPLWPQSAAGNGDTAGTDPFGLGAVLENQARLWNQLLDAQRTIWAFYTPWLQTGPSLWNPAMLSTAADEAGKEPAQTVDGIPDALESQARSWNRFLDANRSFWTAISWQVPAAPWVSEASNTATEVEEDSVSEAPERTAARKTRRARPGAA